MSEKVISILKARNNKKSKTKDEPIFKDDKDLDLEEVMKSNEKKKKKEEEKRKQINRSTLRSYRIKRDGRED